MAMKTIRILRDERGASALEYGLIAGLIALGIVGALATTKSSLNAEYNCIATAVGSSGGTACSSGSAAAASPVGSFWNGKTLQSKTAVAGGYSYKYTDGTTATFNKELSSPFWSHLVVNDPVNNRIIYYLVDSSGSKPIGIEIDNYVSGTTGNYSLVEQAVGSSNGSAAFSGNPPLPTAMNYTTYDAANHGTTTTTNSVTSSTQTTSAFIFYTFGYFQGLNGS